MPIFKSTREKHLWLWVFAVCITIFSTLFLGQPLAKIFRDQNVQAAVFLFVMLLIGLIILLHALRTKARKSEVIIWLGLAAVYIMLFLRLGLAERSHLMEYSVLAIFIHIAIRERIHQEDQIVKPALLALLITFLIGVIDECIQIFLPNRVFDPNDIIFNGFAAAMAIGSNLLLVWMRTSKNTS